MMFPERIPDAEMELRMKEWEVCGARIVRPSRYMRQVYVWVANYMIIYMFDEETDDWRCPYGAVYRRAVVKEM